MTIFLGDLRVCMYCCKVVLSYLPASNIAGEMSADIRALLENLQLKYGTSNFMSDVASVSSSNSIYPSGSNSNLSAVGVEVENTVRRKVSVGYQEEKFAIGR